MHDFLRDTIGVKFFVLSSSHVLNTSIVALTYQLVRKDHLEKIETTSLVIFSIGLKRKKSFAIQSELSVIFGQPWYTDFLEIVKNCEIKKISGAGSASEERYFGT